MEGSNKRCKITEHTLLDLGKDVLGLIYRYTSATDALHLSVTCKLLHNRLDNEIWAFWLKRDFGVTDDDPKQAYKDEYKHKNTKKSFEAAICYAQIGDASGLNCCIRHGVDPSANNNEALRRAAIQGYTDIVKLLLGDARVDPGANVNEAICRAAYKGHTEVVKLLLGDARVDPGANGNEAIRRAAIQGYTDIVKLLLGDARVDPGANVNEAICRAAYKGHTEVVKLLLGDARVDPGDNGNEAICRTAYKGHTEVVKLLLADGRADPTVVDVQLIAGCGYDNILELLLADGRIVVNTDDIEWAARHGLVGAMKLLLPRADPGTNAIRLAAKNGHTEIVKILKLEGCCK